MKYFSSKQSITFIFTLWVFVGCSPNKKTPDATFDQFSYHLGVVAGFCELIAADVKQLALSPTLTKEEMDRFIVEAEKIAKNHGVSIYRETDLLVTNLFPSDVATGLEVLLFYKGTTKDAYLTLKEDQNNLKTRGAYDQQASREISRRFGRILSYSPQKINALLAENTPYRTLTDFGIRANNLFLYYNDLGKATEFYSKTMGFEIVADYGMAMIMRMTKDSYIILVDAKKGMHSAEEPKTVALALLTDQLEEWHEYLKTKNIEIKYPFRGYREGSAHDGFVLVDPEGYLLEIENFNQHPENENFIPLLSKNKSELELNNSSQKLTFHSTITWLYHKDVLAMQNFYQDVLGLEMVADQGWTKIYQVSKTGFMAIVDEQRGMHKFSEKKAVNIGFILQDVDGWFSYVKKNKPFELRDSVLTPDAEQRYRAFVGYGPEGYYYEFDSFLVHEKNQLLLEKLNVVEE